MWRWLMIRRTGSMFLTRPAVLAGKKRIIDKKSTVQKLWQDFFSDPRQWWDNRSEKVNAKYPDFKHKRTQEGLWLDGKLNPPWVEEKLAAMAPGSVQSYSFLWNTRLARCVKDGHYEKTIKLFHQMQQEGMHPDAFSFVPVLKACASVGALEFGRRIHAQIVECGCESDVYVGTCLVDMYAKCDCIEDACTVFRNMCVHDVVSWNAMILGYVRCGLGQRALELSWQMEQEGIQPNAITFMGVLNACGSVMALEEGRHVHQKIIQRGFDCDVYVSNSLVDMYAKCGTIKDAWRVFKMIPVPDVVAWSAMIQGYAKCGEGQKALALFQQMEQVGIEPNPVTFVGVLNACASIAALEEGKRVHEQIIQRGCQPDVFVDSSLIDMYAKCGSVEDAWRVFSMMLTTNVFAWTAMLGAYARHGQAKEALGLFKQMCEKGVEMNDCTFVPLLSACSHAGLVDEGLLYFQCMSTVHSIHPTVDHYACLVDLLGRAGQLHEAEKLIKRMPNKPDATVWSSLLGACRIHGNVEMGECVANCLLELDSDSGVGHLVLSNIYAASQKWDSVKLLMTRS